MTNLASRDIAGLDPCKFMAIMGRRVIHPRGRASAEALLRRAAICGSSRVLDVGCGVATVPTGRIVVGAPSRDDRT
jgi:hypothetical protein